MIETQYFSIRPQRYVGTAMGIWMGRYAWIGIMLLVIGLGAGMYDARFFIVAAALALLAYPGVLMMVYFNHALTKEAAYSVIPHKARLDEGGIKIDYLTEGDRPTPPSQTIAMDEIANAEDTGSALRITLRSGRYDIVEIPKDAFAGDGFARAVALLNSRIHQTSSQ